MKNLVTIVVPVYKEVLSEQEKISLQQLRKVLSHYPTCFAAPAGLTTAYESLGEGVRQERWPSEYFASVRSYSLLLMSREFYERFSNSEYIFIYQLDAFVFSDKLMEFCKMGYDYIGAPIPRSCWLGMPGFVGNGGVSLRRVASMLQLLSEHEDMRLPESFEGRTYCKAEDAIISYWLAVDREKYHLPTVEVAARFALDQDVQHRFAGLSKENLPFACHGWYRAVFPIWSRFIKEAGYELIKVRCSRERFSIRMRAVLNYLIERLLNREGADASYQKTYFLQVVAKQVMPSRRIAVWGYGIMGRKAIVLLEKLGCIVEIIYDSSAQPEAGDTEVRLMRPCQSHVACRKHFLLYIICLRR